MANHDLRELWRPGCKMTLRLVGVILRHMPADAPVWRAIAAEQAAAVQSDFMNRLRERQAHYDRLAAEQ